jgi:hypothetical protein
MVDPLAILEGTTLSSIEFVQDYVQIRFNGPCLTITAPIKVFVGQRVYTNGCAGYRDMLCERIGKRLNQGFTLLGDRLDLQFDDGSKLSISLRAEDQSGPDAAVLVDDLKRQPMCVWDSTK